MFLAGLVVVLALCVSAWRRTTPLEWASRAVAMGMVAAVLAPLWVSAGALPGPRVGGGGLPTIGGTMTGQLVFSGVATDISTGSNETLTIAPAGSGSGVANVKVVSGDSASNTVDWQDVAFCYSDGSAYGVRMTSNYLDFTNNTYASWAAGNIRASSLTIAVQTANNPITLSGLTQFGGPFSHYQGTASFTGTQHNYAGCTNYSLCRLDGSSTPVITGLTTLVIGEQRTLCNYGTTTIQINHQDTNSTAAYRFDLPGAVNYNLVAKSCIFIVWDNVLQRWLKSS